MKRYLPMIMLTILLSLSGLNSSCTIFLIEEGAKEVEKLEREEKEKKAREEQEKRIEAQRRFQEQLEPAERIEPQAGSASDVDGWEHEE